MNESIISKLEGLRLSRMDAYDRMIAFPKNKVAKQVFKSFDKEYKLLKEGEKNLLLRRNLCLKLEE